MQLALQMVEFADGSQWVHPVNADTGEILDGVRSCDVLQKVEGITVVRLEVYVARLIDSTQKVKETGKPMEYVGIKRAGSALALNSLIC